MRAADQSRILAEMRIAVIADIHADLDGLRAVLADISSRRVDEVWCLGDIVGAGSSPAACLALVREHCALVLAGNHDLWALRDDPGARAPELGAWLASLRPHEIRHGVQCWHGGPRNPIMQWITSASDAAPYLLEPGVLTVVAHTHQPAAFLAGADGTPVARRPRAGETIRFGAAACVLNPGAVARPQIDEDPAAYWMLLDLQQRQATWLTVSIVESRTVTTGAGGRRAGSP